MVAGEWGSLEPHRRIRGLSEQGHLLRKVSYFWEGQGSWAKASNLGKGLSDTGGDRVAGQKLPCWGRGIGVLNLGGWY